MNEAVAAAVVLVAVQKHQVLLHARIKTTKIRSTTFNRVYKFNRLHTTSDNICVFIYKELRCPFHKHEQSHN